MSINSATILFSLLASSRLRPIRSHRKCRWPTQARRPEPRRVDPRPDPRMPWTGLLPRRRLLMIVVEHRQRLVAIVIQIVNILRRFIARRHSRSAPGPPAPSRARRIRRQIVSSGVSGVHDALSDSSRSTSDRARTRFQALAISPAPARLTRTRAALSRLAPPRHRGRAQLCAGGRRGCRPHAAE